MKSFDTDIKKYTDKIRLKAGERRELRERVLSYMEYHPLPKQSMKEAVEQIESEKFIHIHLNTWYTRIFGGVFAALLIIVLPLAAERSVPGDILYPIKTEINEGIRLQLANSPYEKIVLETELMERRIAEARLLEDEGKLTEELGVAISETVREHADAAQQGIAELRNDSAEEAAIAEIAFGSALEVQSAVLEADSKNAASSSKTESIAGVVKEAQASVDAQKSSSTPSFGGLMARVEIETTRAYELFTAINETTSEEDRADIERRLQDIDRKIEKAQSLNNEGGEGAVSELKSALALTQKLIVFMTDIEVSQNVALETLVPIELTDEERTTIANHLLNNVLTLRKEVVAKSDTIQDLNLFEKFEFGLLEADANITVATSAIAAGDLDIAEQAISAAYEYVTDLDQMIPDPAEEEIVVEETPAEPAPETEETETEPEISEETVPEEPVLEESPELIE